MAEKRLPYTFPLKLFRYYVMSCPGINNIQLEYCAKTIYEAYIKDLLNYLPKTYADMARNAIEKYLESLKKSERDKVEAWKNMTYTLAVLWDRELKEFGSIEFRKELIYKFLSS